jgi:hypothetical protein
MYSAICRAAACDVSSAVPSGKSSTTWNSDLLSKGSIFTCTSFTPTSAMEPTSSTPTPA